MALEFGNDFPLACEPIAWVWREGDDPVRSHPIAVVNVVDVNLLEILTISFAHWYIDTTTIFTHSISIIECAVVSDKVVSACKNVRSAHVEISTMERFRMRVREKKNGERPDARTQQTPNHSTSCSIFKPACVPGLFLLILLACLSHSLVTYSVCWIGSTI